VVADAGHRSAGTRYAFSVRVHSDDRLVCISGIRMGCLVIPRDGAPRRHLLGAGSPSASSHQRVLFGLTTPYVLVRIAELPSALVASDPGLLGCTCQYVQDGVYDTPSGRGFLRLKPAGSGVIALSTPVACPPSLTVSILRPDGSPLNTTGDAAPIASIACGAPWSPDTLAVTSGEAFDRNEICEGDTVRLSGVSLTKLLPDDMRMTARLADEFLNRGDGHTVLRVQGAPTPADLCTVFYIRAPGRYKGQVFEPDAGTRDSVLAALEAHCSRPGGAGFGGSITNLTLQPAVAMEWETVPAGTE
jgi:hypothetical protein